MTTALQAHTTPNFPIVTPFTSAREIRSALESITPVNGSAASFQHEIASLRVYSRQDLIYLSQNDAETYHTLVDTKIRTALTIDRYAQSIFSNAELYLRENDDPETRERITQIKTQLTELVREALTSLLTQSHTNDRSLRYNIRREHALLTNTYGIDLSTLKRLGFLDATPKGIPNSGNDCWAIALTTMLAHTPLFVDHLIANLSDAQQKIVAEYLLRQSLDKQIGFSSKHLRSLFETPDVTLDTPSNEPSILPQGLEFFLRDLRDMLWAVVTILTGMRSTKPKLSTIEHDASEMLTALTASLEEGNPLFQRMDLSRILRGNAPIIKAEYEFALPLQLPSLPVHVVFEDLLNAYCSSNTYTTDPVVIDGRPHEVRSERRRFTEAPSHLTVNFKRYTFNQKTHRASANRTKVLVSEYTTIHPNLVVSGAPHRYRLQSFIVQTGGMQSGHYISCVRKGNTYYTVNDGHSRQISTEEALEMAQNAYIISYEKGAAITRREAENILQERFCQRAEVDASQTSFYNLSHMQQLYLTLETIQRLRRTPTPEIFNKLPLHIQEKLAHGYKLLTGAVSPLEHLRTHPHEVISPSRPVLFPKGESLLDQVEAHTQYLLSAPRELHALELRTLRNILRDQTTSPAEIQGFIDSLSTETSKKLIEKFSERALRFDPRRLVRADESDKAPIDEMIQAATRTTKVSTT